MTQRLAKLLAERTRREYARQLSDEGFCLSENTIRRLDPSTFRKLTLITAWGPEERLFAPWGPKDEYLADVITGSLYNDDDGSSPAGSPLHLKAMTPSRSRTLPAVA